jgi:hypothetical protein
VSGDFKTVWQGEYFQIVWDRRYMYMDWKREYIKIYAQGIIKDTLELELLRNCLANGKHIDCLHGESL